MLEGVNYVIKNSVKVFYEVVGSKSARLLFKPKSSTIPSVQSWDVVRPQTGPTTLDLHQQGAVSSH